MPDPTQLPASPLHALSVYAEPLVAGRRVVLLGDATLHLGERFLALGARVVHLYDPQPTRAAAVAERSPRGLTVLPFPAGDFDVRDGAFDLAVILDLGEFSAPASVLARVRRLVSAGGTALVRARSADGNARPRGGRGQAGGSAGSGSGAVDYYELYDLVAMQFAHVRMVGQIPWTGVALAELGGGDEEPNVTVDTQLVTEVAPAEAFIAVASQEDVRLAEYALVQMPASAVAAVASATPSLDVESTVAYGNEKADLAAAQLRASLLEAQIEELRTQRNREAVAHSDSVSALEAELAQRVTELQQADDRAAEAGRALVQVKANLRAREEESAKLGDRGTLVLRELEDERRGRRDEIDVERRARAQAEMELTTTKARLESFALEGKAIEAAAARVPGLEMAVAKLEVEAQAAATRLAAEAGTRLRLEEALTSAVIEIDALKEARSHAEARLRAHAEARTSDEAEVGRLAAAATRILELEGAVLVLQSEVLALSDGHGGDLIALESALRDRARITQALEQELARRERIILDLVHAFEEARLEATQPVGASDGSADSRELEIAMREARQGALRARAENAELARKLDAAALEIAKREGENATAGWRIQELEQAVARLEDEQSELTMTIPPPAFINVEREANDVTVLQGRLSSLEDELDLLRQALTQEHEARAKAESGEALRQAKADLARQAALLENLSRELEAHDGVRRPTSVADETTS